MTYVHCVEFSFRCFVFMRVWLLCRVVLEAYWARSTWRSRSTMTGRLTAHVWCHRISSLWPQSPPAPLFSFLTTLSTAPCPRTPSAARSTAVTATTQRGMVCAGTPTRRGSCCPAPMTRRSVCGTSASQVWMCSPCRRDEGTPLWWKTWPGTATTPTSSVQWATTSSCCFGTRGTPTRTPLTGWDGQRKRYRPLYSLFLHGAPLYSTTASLAPRLASPPSFPVPRDARWRTRTTWTSTAWPSTRTASSSSPRAVWTPPWGSGICATSSRSFTCLRGTVTACTRSAGHRTTRLSRAGAGSTHCIIICDCLYCYCMLLLLLPLFMQWYVEWKCLISVLTTCLLLSVYLSGCVLLAPWQVYDLSRIGDEQSPEDAEDGAPELLFVHG